jgi:hypothetical protein
MVRLHGESAATEAYDVSGHETLPRVRWSRRPGSELWAAGCVPAAGNLTTYRVLYVVKSRCSPAYFIICRYRQPPIGRLVRVDLIGDIGDRRSKRTRR